MRGTSLQEGYHSHQSQWITGTHVSRELFQDQSSPMELPKASGPQTTRCNPSACVDPPLVTQLNSTSKRVTWEEKYPILHLSDRDTGERFGK